MLRPSKEKVKKRSSTQKKTKEKKNHFLLITPSSRLHFQWSDQVAGWDVLPSPPSIYMFFKCLLWPFVLSIFIMTLPLIWSHCKSQWCIHFLSAQLKKVPFHLHEHFAYILKDNLNSQNNWIATYFKYKLKKNTLQRLYSLFTPDSKISHYKPI